MQDHEDRIRQKCKASEYVANMQLAHFGKTEWTGWRYNEVIGWLRLYAFPLQGFAQHATIRAEFYAVDAKRISASLKRKRYLYDGAAFEIDVDEGVFSEGIFAHVTNKIYSWAEGWRLKRYAPDLEVWNCIGPHLNWFDLLSVAKPRNRDVSGEMTRTVASAAMEAQIDSPPVATARLA